MCDRHGRVYRRSITPQMAGALCVVVRAERKRGPEHPAYFHVPSLLQGVRPELATGGDYAKLRYWNLLVPKPTRDRPETANRAGEFRVTDDGIDFALGVSRVRRYVYVYDERVVDPPVGDEETITVHDALKSRFDYQELFAW